ncbi:MAG: VacJ family lipoprotein [Rickettsiales bacterium]|nr:VacJ family lipoprotein [Rickettsiales bacterium]
MLKKTVILLVVAQLFAACTTTQASNSIKDPYEPANREVFEINEILDVSLAQPIARGYRAIIPSYGRKAVRNVLRNLNEPVNFINALLQFDTQQAFTSFWRFILNTTLGFGGIYDFAGENSPLKYRQEDFGQTLAVWANDTQSDYVVLPLLGPSTVRDTFGRVVDVAMNPFTYIFETTGSVIWGGIEAVSDREDILDLTDDIYATSFDPYASIRSAYLQRRRAMILNTHNAND